MIVETVIKYNKLRLGTCARQSSGADQGIFLAGRAPLRNDVTYWRHEQIFKANMKNKAFD